VSFPSKLFLALIAVFVAYLAVVWLIGCLPGIECF
jgi:hypothetical protein